MDIDLILDSIHPLGATSRLRLSTIMEEVQCPKGHVLIQADKVEPHIYFIKKGMMRAYANSADNEITFWFGKEGDAVISMRSYVENQKGYEQIELLEDCELFRLDSKELKALMNKTSPSQIGAADLLNRNSLRRKPCLFPGNFEPPGNVIWS